MKRIGKFFKILSDIITLAGIIVTIWFCGSVIEIGTHNTEKSYTYSEYNAVIVWLQTAEKLTE